MRECSPPTTCHMSCFKCQVSHVRCHMSGVICWVSGVKCIFIFCIYFFLQSGGASRWRVFYQQGLSRLVNLVPGHNRHLSKVSIANLLFLKKLCFQQTFLLILPDFPSQLVFILKKTLRESQNAALRNSLRLSIC